MLLLLAVGCTVPLTEIPIDGDPTEVQRAFVQAEAVRFASWVGEERLTSIRAIRMVDETESAYGGDFDGGRISIDRALEGDALTRAVRHALCHALDDAERLSRDDVFVEVADASALQQDPMPADEGFAVLCQLGSEIAALIEANTCDDDAPVALEALARLRSDVWVNAPEAPASIARRPRARGAFPLGKTVASWEVLPTSNPFVIDIEAQYPNFTANWIVDTRNGDQVPEPEGDYVELPPPLPPAGADWSRLTVRAAKKGPAAVSAVLGDVPRGLSAFEERVVAWSEKGGWQPVMGGCVDIADPIGFWVANEQLWFAWQTEDQLEWGWADEE